MKAAGRRVLTAAALLAGMGILWYGLHKNGAFLPGWILWENREITDQSGEYRILLEHKRVRVFDDRGMLWSSPQGVKVQEALSFDMDHDGQDELVVLCWKRGRYGKHRPFWVEKDEAKWSQHIFVYEYEEDEIRPKWMSSYIGQDVVRMEPNKTLAAQKRLWLTDRKGNMSSWIWNSWGFEKEDTEITFALFGDLIAHEPIYRYGLQQDGDFSFLFENFRELLDGTDVTGINQETPLVQAPSDYSGYPVFGTPDGVGEAVADAGFDLVTCATNHMLDRGEEGIRYTKRFFEEKGVLCLGIQEDTEDSRGYEILTRKGVRFALFNYTYGTNLNSLPEDSPFRLQLLKDEQKVLEEFAQAKEEADITLVFVHWGTENSGEADDFQQKWAQVFLKGGADVVIGTHPHVLGPVEVLTAEDGHQMLVYYSIGNFLSAQSEKSCVKGGLAEFTVSLTQEGYRVTEYELVPLKIVWQGRGKYTTDLQ